MDAITDSPGKIILPQGLEKNRNAALLAGILRGAERETLRVDLQGKLARTPHPSSLGSALTHPQITTDFSEALLEFITPPTHRTDDLFIHLETIQKFVSSKLQNETLWSSSMPCILGGDETIPVARYGESNNAKMKSIYRLGLGHRYGRAMQTIAGVHYNFSLPDAFWAWLRIQENSLEDLRDFKDRKYFGLIRNFRRYFWLLIYLFGASPATCASFIANRNHDLQAMEHDAHTLHKPWGTSLRMGDLGYQSSAQEDLYVCYNKRQSYIATLCKAITTPYAAYEHIGILDKQGKYQQLNSGILQIENEFYSAIRPKRTAKPGETALTALCHRGVEYIEVRCLDVDPFSPLGINREQINFLDTFLLYCCLADSPDTHPEENALILKNQKAVVNEGRSPQLNLHSTEKGEVSLQAWARDLIQQMTPIAQVLDQAYDQENKVTQQNYQQSLARQLDKVEDPDLTPSARVLHRLREQQINYPAFAMDLSQQHREQLEEAPLADKITERLEHISRLSINEQAKLEQQSDGNFDNFLKNYYKQYSLCCS